MELFAEKEDTMDADGAIMSELEPAVEPFPQPPPSIVDVLPHPNKSKGKRKIHEENEDERNVSLKSY